MKLVTQLAREMVDWEIQLEARVMSTDDRWYTIIAIVSGMFEEFCKGEESFTKFAFVGGLSEGECLQHLRNYFIKVVKMNLNAICQAITKRWPGMDQSTIHPYVMESLPPNVLSPFHLLSQALCHENVCALHF